MNWVIFDLDHTLLSTNSSFRFGLFLFKNRVFSFWKIVCGLMDYARHKWLRMPIKRLHEKSFERLFKGQSSSQIILWAEKFLDESLAVMLYPPALKRLREAQERGDNIHILSSSPDFLVEAIANRLRVQFWKATTYQVDSQGLYSVVSAIMEGDEKAAIAKQIAGNGPFSLSSLTVYSDSYLDLPVLRVAGKAVGVCPDFRLKKICQNEGWEIL